MVNKFEPKRNHDGVMVLASSPIDVLGFTVRVTNCFRDQKITKVGDLIQYSEKDLLKIHKLGKKCLKEIKEELASFNFELLGEEISKMKSQ